MGDSEILSMICRIGIFIVCAQTMIHFRPKGSYEQYFKLLVSVMILAQILQPLSRLFLWDENGDLETRIRRIQQELELQMQVTAEETAKSEEILEKMTLEEVNSYLQEEGTVEEGKDGKESNRKDDGVAAQGQMFIETMVVQPVEKIEIEVTDEGEKNGGQVQ